MEKKPQFFGPRRPSTPRPRPGQRPMRRGQRQDPYATNEQIRARQVRLVGDNVEQGIYPIEKALKIARSLELDLIEISPTADPPVCKILDYSKFLYQQKKRAKEQKAKASKWIDRSSMVCGTRHQTGDFLQLGKKAASERLCGFASVNRTQLSCTGKPGSCQSGVS